MELGDRTEVFWNSQFKLISLRFKVFQSKLLFLLNIFSILNYSNFQTLLHTQILQSTQFKIGFETCKRLFRLSTHACGSQHHQNLTTHFFRFLHFTENLIYWIRKEQKRSFFFCVWKFNFSVGCCFVPLGNC